VQEILGLTQAWFRTQVRDKLPMNSLLSKIAHMDLAAWADLDTKKFRDGLPKIKLSEDIAARVRQKLAKARDPKQAAKEEINQIEFVVQTLQAVVFEAHWVAYTINCNDWRVILAHDAIIQMFGADVMKVVIKTINSDSEVERMVDEHIRSKHFAYRNLTPEEVFPELFANSKRKQSIGLVYVSFDLANTIIAELP
jgi:hypothetical protein